MSVFQGAQALSEGRLAQGGTRLHAPSASASESNLNALTVAQLRALAAERGVEVPSKATKAKLLEILGG